MPRAAPTLCPGDHTIILQLSALPMNNNKVKTEGEALEFAQIDAGMKVERLGEPIADLVNGRVIWKIRVTAPGSGSA